MAYSRATGTREIRVLGKEHGMRRATLLLLAMVVALSVRSLPSLAKSIYGAAGNDTAITDIGLTGQRIDIFENCEKIFPIPVDPRQVTCSNRTGQQANLSKLGREDLKRAVEDGLLRETEG